MAALLAALSPTAFSSAEVSRADYRDGYGITQPIAEDQTQCLNGPCMPGNEFCAKPFENAPVYHLMNQHGCAENDPNGPIFDPVHGVIHHFYQIHLAAAPGRGPDYGHFVSKDFVHWAPLPVAIWNGLDSSVTPNKVTPYDNEAIYTGSGVIVDGAGPGGVPGIVQVYPGLCNKRDWPDCETGTLLAQAVPANYASDELLVNWTKPSYNPIMNNTQRDPSTPWKTPSGEWRLRTYDAMVYGSASDADMLAGRWYEIGKSPDLRQCECPSLYPLPAPTAGTEVAYEAAARAGMLPNTVHKTSCGGDFWQLGTYTPGPPKTLGNFSATPGWDDLFKQKRIDFGKYYASKDSEYPTLAGGKRRINWGWAIVDPASVQSLPREITFNMEARQLQQYPIEELKSLRGAAIFDKSALNVDGTLELELAAGMARQSELVATFMLPATPATFGVAIGTSNSTGGVPVERMMPDTDLGGGDYLITHYQKSDNASTTCQAACDADPKCKAWTYVIRGQPAGSGDCCLKSSTPCPRDSSICTSGVKSAAVLPGCGSSSGNTICTVDYTPPPQGVQLYQVPVNCDGYELFADTLSLLPTEKSIELRMFTDWTMTEAYFQQGRVAITAKSKMDAATKLIITSTAAVKVDATVFPMNSIWVDEESVRKAPRVYK